MPSTISETVTHWRKAQDVADHHARYAADAVEATAWQAEADARWVHVVAACDAAEARRAA